LIDAGFNGLVDLVRFIIDRLIVAGKKVEYSVFMPHFLNAFSQRS